MTDYKKIFIDTSPIIYYLQKSDLYFESMKSFWKAYSECDFITSAITITEYLVFPYQQQEKSLITGFFSFINNMDIDIQDINGMVAEKAAQIRAEYKRFKTMDALQLSVACLAGCDLFLTNDKQLKQFKDIEVVLVDEL